MSNTNGIKVNGNVIRRAMTEAYENGNRRMLREGNFTDLGGDAHDWWEYARVIAALETAARAWCAIYFSTNKDKKEMDRLESVIIDHEKTVFSWVKTDETAAYFHATEKDGEMIALMADTYIQKRNNVNGVKGFVSERVHAPASHADFQKRFENHIGTLIDKQSWMTVEEAEYIRREGKFVSKVNSAKSKMDKAQENINNAEAQKKTNPQFAAVLDKMIASYNEELTKATSDYSNAVESLTTYLEGHPNRKEKEKTIQEYLGILSETKTKLEKLEKPADKPLDVEAIMHRGLSRLTKDQIMLELRHRKVEFDENLSRNKLRKVLKGARDAEPVVQEVMEEVAAEATVA